jgi:energy-coupling factor transporter ATP-binding protein EcfA2
MRVRQVKLRNFRSHASLDVSLPDTGVVLVTGDSGSGKSSIVSAVDWAAHGGSGARVIRVGESQCEVVLTLDTGVIHRTRTRTTTKLQARYGSEWRTATQAQEYIDQHVLPLPKSLWRKVLTFSEDAGNRGFAGTASDEKYKLLEGLADVSGVVPLALVAAKRDHHTLREKKTTKQIDASAATAAIEKLNALKNSPHRVNAARQLIYVKSAVEIMDDWFAYTSDLSHKVKERQIAAAPQVQTCPTCGAVTSGGSVAAHSPYVTDHLVRRMMRHVAMKRTNALSALAHVKNTLRQLTADIDSQLDDLFDKALSASTEAEKLSTDLVYVDECVRALSSSGLRAHMVSMTLSAMSDLTNRYLAILFPSVQVRFEIDASLDSRPIVTRIEGHSLGVNDIDDMSRGERRRVQVASALALADFARSQTMFLDEVADGVDATNVGLMADAIHQAASDRCVVVITHNPNLIAALSGRHSHHIRLSP